MGLVLQVQYATEESQSLLIFFFHICNSLWGDGEFGLKVAFHLCDRQCRCTLVKVRCCQAQLKDEICFSSRKAASAVNTYIWKFLKPGNEDSGKSQIKSQNKQIYNTTFKNSSMKLGA